MAATGVYVPDGGPVIEFEVWGLPRAQLAPRAYIRGKHADVYDPRVSKDWKDLVVRQIGIHRPPRPWEGPIRLSLEFRLPMPKGWPKYRKKLVEEGGVIYHVSRPDLEQYTKPIKDAMTVAGFWVDDSQIADAGGTRKIFAVSPGLRVRVESLDEEVTR